MKYMEFKEEIERYLQQHPAGAVWLELKDQLKFTYKIPCPEWTRRLENEIDLERVKGPGRALVWRIKQ